MKIDYSKIEPKAFDEHTAKCFCENKNFDFAVTLKKRIDGA